MTRREAREQALSMIFEMNFNDNSVDEMVDNALIFRDESVDEYAVQIAQRCACTGRTTFPLWSSTAKSGKQTVCPRFRWPFLCWPSLRLLMSRMPRSALLSMRRWNWPKSMLARRMLPTSMACWAVMFVERWAKQPSLRKPKNDSGECCGRWVARLPFCNKPQ